MCVCVCACACAYVYVHVRACAHLKLGQELKGCEHIGLVSDLLVKLRMFDLRLLPPLPQHGRHPRQGPDIFPRFVTVGPWSGCASQADLVLQVLDLSYGQGQGQGQGQDYGQSQSWDEDPAQRKNNNRDGLSCLS